MIRSRSAAASNEGYLHQLDRALYRLSQGSRQTCVGVETLDDVACVEGDNVSLEQSKITLSGTRNPLSDGSVELWKTLVNWLEAINSNVSGTPQSEYRFYLVTNKILPKDGLAVAISEAQSPDQVRKLSLRLQAEAQQIVIRQQDPAAEITLLCRCFLTFTPTEIESVIRLTQVIDGTEASSGDALLAETIKALKLSEVEEPVQIVDAMYGWLRRSLRTLWQQRSPGWITGERFYNQLDAIRRLSSIRRLDERIQAEILKAITDAERDQLREAVFVREIERVFGPGTGTIKTAIDDYLCAKSERMRLSLEGHITSEDFQLFDSSLHRRWADLFEMTKEALSTTHPNDDEAQKHSGRSLYHSVTKGYKEPLAGIPTTQQYLTSGTYQDLAAGRYIGWHPSFGDDGGQSDIANRGADEE